AGQSTQFMAAVSGAANMAVTWSISPAIGNIGSGGLYTAPSSVSSAQTVTVTATSVADSTKTSTATITLDPPVSVSVTPAAVTLSAGQSAQFMAAVSGAGNMAVTWSISPAIGSIGSGGLYTAPSNISSAQTVTVTATSLADAAKSARATIGLIPPPPPPPIFPPVVSVSVSVNPTAVTLAASGQAQLTAIVSGTSDTAVTWSLSPAVGSVSDSGLYTAPSSISSEQSVTVTATSEADPTKTAAVTITLNPPAGAVLLSPTSISVGPAQQVQFAASVFGSANSGVVWNLSPAIGSLSDSGLYTAPLSATTNQPVTITATSVADRSRKASATVVVLAGVSGKGFSVSFTNPGGGQLQVNWTAPGGRPAGDYITLASPGAQDSWYLNRQDITGASGSFRIPMPGGPGDYEFRYCLSGTHAVAARSATLPVNAGGFSLTPLATTVTRRRRMTILFTAPAGRPADWNGDRIVLYRLGGGPDHPERESFSLGEMNGKLTLTAPSTPGTYAVLYLVAGEGYVSAAQNTFVVQ
ncbi:MAG: hypothetical protein KGN84_08725, partial [Acidobacteriota bacterium]|nr:hypothetical protein [Acidobacteriota bacterium]